MPERSDKGDGGQRAPPAVTTAKDLPVLAFATARAWSEWLEAHHASSRGLWLKIAKKGAGAASVTYAEALDGALAWGWIDGQKGTLNDVWWLQRFTPRTAKSPWSKINRAKAEALIAAERWRFMVSLRWSARSVTAGGSVRTTEHVPQVCPRTSLPHSRETLVRESSSTRSTVRTAMQSFTACRRRRSQRRASSASHDSSHCVRGTRQSIRDVRRSQPLAPQGLRRRLGPRSRPGESSSSAGAGQRLMNVNPFVQARLLSSQRAALLCDTGAPSELTRQAVARR